MSGVAIRVEGLVRDFPKVRALDHLSFDVPSGIVFGFLGPNGAGKTTVIRVLLGLVDPTEGRSEVFGFDPRCNGDAVRARAGALLEHNGVYERLTAYQNLDFYARVWRLSRGDRHARIRELLSQLGLWERRDEAVGSWSRGMKQKLAVARAVLHRPPLVFLDEPTAGLDPVASASLRDDLARLALGRVLAKDERQLVVLDDVLNATDTGRLARVLTLLEESADHLQIVILTCHPERYRALEQAQFFELQQRSG